MLEKLTGRRLLLITKGDSLDQESKIRRSGLARFFPVVEVLVDKTLEAYASLLSKHAIQPNSFFDGRQFLTVGYLTSAGSGRVRGACTLSQ